jgi:hypothetical protein
VGWMHRMNTNPSEAPALYNIGIKLATHCINSDISIHPIHIEGKKNRIADDLSRINSIPNSDLT